MAGEKVKLFAEGARVEKIATGMKFLEGPVYMPDGVLIFSDQQTDKTMRWSPRDGLCVHIENGNGCNGNTLDLQGRRITCEGTMRRVVLHENDGAIRTLVDSMDGKKFHSPNDVIVKSDGTLWFTDPPYWLPKDATREFEHNNVFVFDPKTERTKILVSDFDMPNGLCFSPDEQKLYIADSGKPHHVRVFDVNTDNTIINGKVFCVIAPGVPDGIRADERGNLWSTAGDGVHVFSPDGKLIEKIPVPETPANLCFGGEDGRTLFITARTSLYIRVSVRGAAPAPSPSGRGLG